MTTQNLRYDDESELTRHSERKSQAEKLSSRRAAMTSASLTSEPRGLRREKRHEVQSAKLAANKTNAFVAGKKTVRARKSAAAKTCAATQHESDLFAEQSADFVAQFDGMIDHLAEGFCSLEKIAYHDFMPEVFAFFVDYKTMLVRAEEILAKANRVCRLERQKLGGRLR
jgi:hypothetical protein